MKINLFSVKMNTVAGGGSNHTLDLKIRYLVQYGYSVCLTTMYSSGNKFVEKPAYRVEEMDFRGSNFLRLQNSIAKILLEREEDYDLFHLDGHSFIWGGGKYKRRSGKKPVVAYINNYLPSISAVKFESRDYRDRIYGYKRCFWDKYIGLKYANLLDIIFVDSPVVKKIYSEFGFKGEKLHVLPEFVEVKEMLAKDPGPSPFAGKSKCLNLLYVGRLNKSKGVHYLLEAASKFVRNGEVDLHIIGDGPEKKSLYAFAKELGIDSGIFFYGWKSQEELFAYYHWADLFVHPCLWPEPFGRTIVESLSFGTPVLAPSGTGSEWIIGKAGMIFERGDKKDLEDKLEILIKDPGILQDLKSETTKRALYFDYRAAAQDFEQKIQSLVH